MFQNYFFGIYSIMLTTRFSKSEKQKSPALFEKWTF